MSERRDILGQVLRETGMTQSELSRLSGVRQPSISQMLSGRIPMSDDMLRRLLSCMGRDPQVAYHPTQPELAHSVRRSWLLHRRLSRQLDPETLDQWTPRIFLNLEQMSEQVRGEPHTRNLERWSRLAGESDLVGLRRVLTGLDEGSIQMREVSPVRGLLSQKERSEALRQVD